MPVTGNGPDAIRDMLRGLSELAEGDWKAGMNKSLGAELVALVKRGFRTSTDPYGRPWAPLKQRSGKPLLRTARLRNSWMWSAGTDSGQITITNNVQYAAFHQDGTARMVQRQMFPEADLPPLWADRLSAVAELVVSQHVKQP